MVISSGFFPSSYVRPLGFKKTGFFLADVIYCIVNLLMKRIAHFNGVYIYMENHAVSQLIFETILVGCIRVLT